MTDSPFDAERESPAAWPKLGSEPVGDYRIFRVRRDRTRSPRTGEELDFYVLEMPDWVNVVPVTDDGRVVLVEQYRPGTGEVTLEFPAGIVDAGEGACEAGARELEEETGFVAGACTLMRVLEPNPAIQNNRLYTVMATGCVDSGSRSLDPAEDIAVRTVPLADIPALIADGSIRHAHSVAAWYCFVARRAEAEAEAARE